MTIDITTVQSLFGEYLYEISVFAICLIPAGILAWWGKRNARKAVKDGLLNEEVVIHFMVVEAGPNGETFLKPRVGISSRTVSFHFPNHHLVTQIIAATKRCDSTPDGSFVRLSDPHEHRELMKHARAIVSGTNPAGQAARAAGLPCRTEIFYVYVTFSTDSDAQRRIRIDAIHESDLPLFKSDADLASLRTRVDEGSHDDHKAILRLCAAAQEEGDESVCIRTSVSFPVQGDESQ